MKRPSTITVVVALALLFAGCASFYSYRYLTSRSASAAQGVFVVAAARDIPVGAKLAPADLKVAEWPAGASRSGYASDPKSLYGRVAVRPISAGDLVSEPKLMPKNVSASGGVMTYLVPEGHRAVTVPVNEVAGVAGFITPGSRVDVVLTTPKPGRSDKDDKISKIILQNVPVLATGQGTEQKEGKPVVVPTVTLDLVPEDAEKLVVGVGNGAAGKGGLQLLLRNVTDTVAVTTKGATIPKALDLAEAPVVTVASRKAYRPRVVSAAVPVRHSYAVEVIQGTVKTTREFSSSN